MIVGREFKEKAGRYFTGKEEGFATTLLSILLGLYGTEVLEWDGATIQLQVKDDLGVEMPRKVYDKLMGLITSITTDSIYHEVPVFDETVAALAGEGIGVQRDIPAVEDVAWAVAELGLADPEPVSRDAENPWGSDISKYVRVVLDDEGMNIAPSILGFAPGATLPKEGQDDPAMYAGAWGSQQDRADEIDAWVQNQMEKLVMQLQDLGIQFGATASA